MVDENIKEEASAAPKSDTDEGSGEHLEGGAYEVIRGRLLKHGADLRSRLGSLNNARKDVFGAIDTKLLATERISTENNCFPQDMIAVGNRFLFGYNVQLGLRSEMKLSDVFAVYAYDAEERIFRSENIELINNEDFRRDFAELYRYYKKTRFLKFWSSGPILHMVFQIGATASDIKTFKWIRKDGVLTYVDNRSDHEFRLPPQHEFEWTRATRDMHRGGLHPHISIDDRIFVETVGGDLTVKVEDNTEVGEGIYSEPVENADQTLDDAEISYALVGSLILLRVLPYQEKKPRYIVYNEKVGTARRIDAIADSCVLLPEDHGIIFANGYYLQNGEYKTFDGDFQNMAFERRIASPNGEDYMYVFWNHENGVYVLLYYNLIDQQVRTPVFCGGYSLFEDGEVLYFRNQEEAQKHHAIQIWQTPFVGPDYEIPSNAESHLYKIGNREIVRCMAECTAMLNLLNREESYADLYIDIVRRATDILDAYFWLDHAEAFGLKQPIQDIQSAAAAAIDEFEKVIRLKKANNERLQAIANRVKDLELAIINAQFQSINDFVDNLALLRTLRGEIISLRELRYLAEADIDAMEADVSAKESELAQNCVTFLLEPDALTPYGQEVEDIRQRVDAVKKVADGKTLEEDAVATAAELELLIDIVSNLKIDDATQRTAIVDNISTIYSDLNQVRAAIRRCTQELAGEEGKAEFAAQMKLLNQALVNYLDVCDSPAKADEYLTKTMVQVTDLEGRFADFDEFVIQLTEKREEIYNAFETRKLSLVEASNRKADALMQSAERILTGLQTRISSLKTTEEIHGYFAGDLLVDKVRDIVKQLKTLDDSVKADDIQSRMKTIREDAIRQLKDRQDLYEDGDNVIRLGNHRFSVNTQALDLTIVPRNEDMYLHLTGTDFFEKIKEPEFLQTRDVWGQSLVSETPQVYRAEYLAYCIFKDLQDGREPGCEALLLLDEQGIIAYVQEYMSSRYAEGYVKGVHDRDAAKILRSLVDINLRADLLRYHTSARALAQTFWHHFSDSQKKHILQAKLKSFGALSGFFPGLNVQDEYVAELHSHIAEFITHANLFDPLFVNEAATYLFHVISRDTGHPVSPEAAKVYEGFLKQLNENHSRKMLDNARETVKDNLLADYELLRDWVSAYTSSLNNQDLVGYSDEVTALLHCNNFDSARTVQVSVISTLEKMSGEHPLLKKEALRLHYNEFMLRLNQFESNVVPRFKSYGELKKSIVDKTREEMRLEEFRPRVLTSFVRNKLIDQVYLPIVGDNLAKQIGVVGEAKRTDLMGLLLLVSPPGYGKTTLMEYIANRLGIIFMKINGPAIGNQVTSLDPQEAPNASAREELSKLNLSLEMGDNVMLYLDDIQHCNPELLQKFISLCDGQRRIEGVYKGRPRSYDLRGKKVVVVMAGNPYTESGEKFKIPDMLANRADTYNLGDIIGSNEQPFRMSYIENALTSNATLAPVAGRSMKDIYELMNLAETDSREGLEFEGNYSGEELSEYLSVMKKLLRVRDVILAVNQEYIRSAAQADEFRTEPPFKLQGSYRNMNRIAEKIIPIMNDDELEALVLNHYENEAQTLTTGTEANMLKFKQLIGRASEEDISRWAEICKTFQRNQLFRGTGSDDRGAQIVAQLSTFTEGLDAIRKTLQDGSERLAQGHEKSSTQPEIVGFTPEAVASLQSLLKEMKPLPPLAPIKIPAKFETTFSADTMKELKRLIAALPVPTVPAAVASGAAARQGNSGATPIVEVVNKVPSGMLHILREQFEMMQAWLDPLLKQSIGHSKSLNDLEDNMESLSLAYKNLIMQIEKGNRLHEIREVTQPKAKSKKKGN